MTKIINLFAGPGAGKSTQASGLFFEMKKLGYNVEMPYEYPKLLAWEHNKSAIKDQLYVTANQHRNIARIYGQVDYIIIDSPILFALVYKDRYNDSPEYPATFYSNKFDEFIIDLHNHYDSLNILLQRNPSMFKEEGRLQNLSESMDIDNDIVNMLDKHSIQYHKVEVNDSTIEKIIGLLK